jgi:hypothetical protein
MTGKLNPPEGLPPRASSEKAHTGSANRKKIGPLHRVSVRQTVRTKRPPSLLKPDINTPKGERYGSWCNTELLSTHECVRIGRDDASD